MFTADLHIHGRFSRGTSKDLTIKNLEKYARMKGIGLLGTGDFTHPEWMKEIKASLKDGIRTETGFPFVLSSEVALIYSDEGKGRRIHNLILAPEISVAEQITEYLKTKGRVDYDGRPIFGIPCPEFTEQMMRISSKIEVIPAHAWTPWFSIFGSKSGFDSLKECFKDQAKNIHAIETGLSSNPQMNWRLSQLDNTAVVSFSDLHSYWPWRLGREATIFSGEPCYDTIIKELREKSFYGTIEVDPAYGKYHYDGHRSCNIVMSPKESALCRKICPKCGKMLTVGVDSRISGLADREEGYEPEEHPKVITLMPLSELISAVYCVSMASKKHWEIYKKFVTEKRDELFVLMNMPFNELAEIDEKIAQVIILNRESKIRVQPGYDGVYGEPVLSDELRAVCPKNKKRPDEFEDEKEGGEAAEKKEKNDEKKVKEKTSVQLSLKRFSEKK
jgi:uncharacterized protein (TIGR00375 family)